MKFYKWLDLIEFLALSTVFLASIFEIGSLLFLGKFHISTFYLLLGGILFAVLIKTKKIANQSIKRLEYFSSSFHGLTHLLRDEYFILGKAYQANIFDKACIIENLNKTAESAINYLAESLSVSTGENVSTCIKYFCIEDPSWKFKERLKTEVHQVPDNLAVKTLCRSVNSDQRRFDSDKYTLTTENTALDKILNFGCDSFYCTDLKALKSKGPNEYINANPNWQNYYNSTIVVPIRIKCKHIDNNITDGSYNLLGFLCADAATNEAFQDNEVSHYLELMKSYADALYPFFDRALFLLDSAKKD